ncbi:MAG: hypothetical protein ACTHX6_02525, partial [Lactobacillus delbrueckii]
QNLPDVMVSVQFILAIGVKLPFNKLLKLPFINRGGEGSGGAAFFPDNYIIVPFRKNGVISIQLF